MTGDVKVVEDGVERRGSEPRPQGPSWFWLIVGLVIGLGLAVVYFTAESAVPEDSSEGVSFPNVDQPDDSSDDPTPTTVGQTPRESEAEGVGEAVEGFPDTLIAATQVGAGHMSLLTWPVSGPPHSDSLPGFATASVKFDLAGRMLAMTSPIGDSNLGLLSVGTAPRVRPMATDVSGYAWHDSEPGLLAYTRVTSGEWELWRVDSSLDPQLITRGVGIEGGVATWGEWGYAIQGEGDVVLLTEGGEFKTEVGGRALDSGPNGWLVMSDQGLKLVSSGGGVDRLDVDLDLLGSIEAARFSPDGTKLVVVGDIGLVVMPLDEEGELLHVPVTSGSPRPTWTSDSRFVISPWARGVHIFDTRHGELSQPLLTRHTVVAVATIPLTDR